VKWLGLVAGMIVLAFVGWSAYSVDESDVAHIEAPLTFGEVAPDSVLPSESTAGGEAGISRPTSAPGREGSTAERVDSIPSGVRRVELTRVAVPAQDGPTGITGVVTGTDGKPVAGVVVGVVERTRGGVRSLGQARTDDSGTYLLPVTLDDFARRDFPTSSEWYDLIRADAESEGPMTSAELAALHKHVERLERDFSHVGELVVSVEDALGFRAETSFRAKSGERLRRVDLRILREYRFSGEVLDGLTGAPFANVMLFDAERELVARTDADAAGEFELPIPPAGRFELHARAGGHGAGGLGGVSLGPDQRSLPQTIALRGDGVLRGRVLYPSGDPVSGLEVHGVLESLASRHPELPLHPTPADLLEEEREGGLALSSSWTDEAGRFRMVGMQPGSFQLLFVDGESGVDPSGVFRTGPDNDIRLKASRVRVHLDSADEGEVREMSVHCIQADWRRVEDGAPVHHEVAVSRDGVAQFLMPSEFDWVVFAELGGQRSQEFPVKFRSRPGDGFAQIDLTPDRWTSAESLLEALTPPEDLSRLDFVVLDPRGEQVKSHLWLWRIEDERLAPLHVKRVIEEGRGIPALRAGSFRYRLQLAEREESLWLPSKHVVFDLEPGADVRLEAQARPMLDLRLTVVQEEGAPPRAMKASVFHLKMLTGVDPRGGAGVRPHALMLGEELRVQLPRSPGAHRLQLSGVGENEERFECTLPLRDDEANRFELVLTDG